MRICRAEIARSQAVTPRPNFVVLLGDRHGWCPLPDEIPAAEFEALRPYLPAALANRSYRFDENAVCPLPDGPGLDKGRYILQPRTGEFADYGKWFDEVEGPLGDAFRRAGADRRCGWNRSFIFLRFHNKQLHKRPHVADTKTDTNRVKMGRGGVMTDYPIASGNFRRRRLFRAEVGTAGDLFGLLTAGPGITGAALTPSFFTLGRPVNE